LRRQFNAVRKSQERGGIVLDVFEQDGNCLNYAVAAFLAMYQEIDISTDVFKGGLLATSNKYRQMVHAYRLKKQEVSGGQDPARDLADKGHVNDVYVRDLVSALYAANSSEHVTIYLLLDQFYDADLSVDVRCEPQLFITPFTDEQLPSGTVSMELLICNVLGLHFFPVVFPCTPLHQLASNLPQSSLTADLTQTSFEDYCHGADEDDNVNDLFALVILLQAMEEQEKKRKGTQEARDYLVATGLDEAENRNSDSTSNISKTGSTYISRCSESVADGVARKAPATVATATATAAAAHVAADSSSNDSNSHMHDDGVSMNAGDSTTTSMNTSVSIGRRSNTNETSSSTPAAPSTKNKKSPAAHPSSARGCFHALRPCLRLQRCGDLSLQRNGQLLATMSS
jgi:hypothetical protein